MGALDAEARTPVRLDTCRWEQADLSTPGARDAVSMEIGRLGVQASGKSLFHELAWLLEAEDRDAGDVELYLLRRGGSLIAYAPFILQPWALRFRLGEVTLFSIRLQRLHLNGGPVLEGSDVVLPALEGLFAQLRPRLSRNQVIYLEGVAVGGAVDRAVSGEALGAHYRVIEPSPRYERQLIRFPGSFEAYMQSLKTNTRQNLRNSQRKLERHLSGDVRLVTCSTKADVPAFVRKAAAISKKTYQWHLLGLGLRDSERLERTLTAMAERGWTRCYVLECGGAPVAFMLGYLYRDTYYYVDVGYDPDWAKWSVGTILHLEVFRDLIEGTQRSEWFDFSSGTGVHKERFGNESRAEANYVLLPRTVRNAVLVPAYQGFTALTDVVLRVADNLGLKARIKKLVRRLSTSRPAAG